MPVFAESGQLRISKLIGTGTLLHSAAVEKDVVLIFSALPSTIKIIVVLAVRSLINASLCNSNHSEYSFGKFWCIMLDCVDKNPHDWGTGFIKFML